MAPVSLIEQYPEPLVVTEWMVAISPSAGVLCVPGRTFSSRSGRDLEAYYEG